MDTIILASQVKVGDFIRFSLKGYFFSRDPKWRENCERILKINHISPTPEGRFEFYFDDNSGVYREIDPDTEVILVHRPWPEGKDREQMLQEIRHIVAVPQFISLVELREAINSYLLGLPTKIQIPGEPQSSPVDSIDIQLKG